MSVREGVLECMCVYLSSCVAVQGHTRRKENEKETDTNRQYMFLICPLCVREKETQRKSKIMDATDVAVTNV